MAGNNDNYIGLAMGLDVTDLKAGLTETKKEISTAQKEFKAATSGMDDWSKSSEGLNAKLKQLNTTFAMQEKNVNGIQAELDHAKEKFGENSEQVRKLNDKLLDAKSALGKTEKEQRKYSAMLDKVESETKDTAKATDKMSKSFRTADKETSKLKGGFTVLKGAMANLVSSGVKSVVSGIQNVVTESREFRREMGYLQSGAKDMGVSFEDAERNVKKVASITEDQGAAVEGLNNLMTAGFDKEALDQITDDLLGASIKWKDTLKFEGLSDGLQETMATGKAVGPFVELLERGGMVAEDFDEGLAKANTQAEKQQYILDTLSKLGLSDIKDGYVEANKSLVEGAEANFEYSKAMAGVGAKAEPVLNAVKLGFANVLTSMLETGDGMDTANISGKIADGFKWFIETGVPFIKNAVGWIIDNFKAIAVVVGIVGGAFAVWKVSEAINGTVKAVKGLVKVMKLLNIEVIKNTANWIKNTAATVLSKAATVASTAATKLATAAQKALNLVLKANPIGIVITVIMALVAAFTVLWNKSDKFREFWQNLWKKIKDVAEKVVKAISKFFNGAWEAIKKVWSGAKKFFSGIWNGIKAVFSGVINFYKNIYGTAWKGVKAIWDGAKKFFSGVWNGIKSVFSNVTSWFKDKFKGAWNGIKSAFGNVKDFFGDVIDKITGAFSNLPDEMMEIGKQIINGLIDGIKNAPGALVDAVKDVGNKIKNGFTSFFNINSPSRLMRDEVGKMLGLGIGDGLLGSTKSVLKDVKGFSSKISSGLSANVGKIKPNVSASGVNGAVGNTVINNNYVQTINAPKMPSRLDLYRQSKNLLSLKGGR